ncbi:MAG: transposase [Clostridia bacterium]|nr:transposase [Clostridia bacterium]
MGKHNKYSPEFKIKCVKDVLKGKHSQEEVALKNGMTNTNIRRWIKNYQEHGEEYFYQEHRGGGGGNPYAALHRKKNLSKTERLELENLKLRIENERLKKGYTVEGVGANKEFVIFYDKNMKS